MSIIEQNETLTEIVTERLITDIVSGALSPDLKLRIEELKERYRTGASPLREALARLVSLGFVTASTRRGFRVASISAEDLDEITRVRQMIETAALRRAVAFDDDEWEIGIVTAFARFGRNAARAANGQKDGSEIDIESAHKQFHAALVAYCRSPRLTQLQETYYDQARRYRHLFVNDHSVPHDFVATHERLMRIVLGRDIETACLALSDHLALTPAAVYPEKEAIPRRKIAQ